MKLLGVFFILVFQGNLVFCQSKFVGDTVFKRYTYAKGKYDIAEIVLKKDNTYCYLVKNDLQTFSSSGRWVINDNMLILNSEFQKDNLVLKVTPQLSNDTSSNYKIPWITNFQGDIIKNARLFINGDSLNPICMPIFDDCRIKIGDIHSLQVKLDNGIQSDWYVLPTEKYNIIGIAAKTPINVDFYIFLDNERFIIEGKKLYETESKSQIKVVKKHQFYFKEL